MTFPFEVKFEEVQADLDRYVDAVFECLESEFLVMPKGPGFIDFPIFEQGYEALKKSTQGFRDVTPKAILPTVNETPVALLVLRCILGFTPPEWAYLTTDQTGVQVTQGAIRNLDRSIRMHPASPLRTGPRSLTGQRLQALVETACTILTNGAPVVSQDRLHRLDKADTAGGLPSLRTMAAPRGSEHDRAAT
jgi:hypothetical protein